MDLFSLAVALIPIACYMLVLGAFHLRKRPYVQTGFADTVLLGLAISGLVLVGPLDLFLPEILIYRYGWFVRVLLLALFFLVLLMVGISRRPRMVIYNMQYSELRETIAEVVQKMDASAYWAGRSAYLPNARVDFHIDPETPTQTIQVVSLSKDVNFTHWTAFRKKLTEALQSRVVTPNLRATWLVGGAAMIVMLVTALCMRDMPALAQSFREWMIR